MLTWKSIRNRALAPAGLIAAACSSPVEIDQTEPEFDAEVQQYTADDDNWYSGGFNKTVPFCWCPHESCNASKPLVPSSTALTNMKQWTEEAVQESWGRSGLTITFTDPCPQTGQYVNIETIHSSSLAGVMGIGSGGKKAYGSRTGYMPYHSTFSETRLKGLAIHELGHSLGLQHTQGRVDGVTGCKGSTSSGRLTMFDGMSVMATNPACRGNRSRQGSVTDPPMMSGPTGLDLAGFQMHYGFPNPFKKTSRNFCQATGEDLVFGDFDGDERTDMLCNNNNSGVMHLERANNGFSGPSDWIVDRDFCTGSSDFLRVGDFDDNGRDDLFCLDKGTGLIEIDLSNSSGQFGGVDWSSDINFCMASTDTIVIGDFNGDGNSDVLCNHRGSGDMQIDYWESGEYFAGPDWTDTDRNFCISSDERLRVGDFDGDSKYDLLCENKVNGALRIDLANDTFNDTDFYQSGRGFCDADSSLIVADVSGDGRDDLICWQRSSGLVKIDVGDAEGFFDDVNPLNELYFKARGTLSDFCMGNDVELYVSDFDANGKADFMCIGDDLKIEYSQLPLPLLYHQVTIGLNQDFESEYIHVPSGSHLQAMVWGHVNDKKQNVDLAVYDSLGPLCTSDFYKSYEVCEVEGPGDFMIIANNNPSQNPEVTPEAASVTVQAYVMAGDPM